MAAARKAASSLPPHLRNQSASAAMRWVRSAETSHKPQALSVTTRSGRGSPMSWLSTN
jgi:hypothetical protein